MHEPLGAVRKPLAEASHAPGFIYGAPDVFTHGPFPPLATLAGRLGGGA